jgi:Leucine-rich repeat (LRR) protein
MGLAFDLKCWKIDVTVLFGGKSFNRCFVKNLQITQRGEKMTSKSSISTLSAIQGFYFNEGTVNFVPRVDDVPARNLKSLAIYHCHLKEIKREDLDQFPELEEIALFGNDLTTLPGNLFLGSRKIQRINLEFNNFKTIGEEVLEPLKSLTLAYIYSSGCVSFKANTRAEVETLKMKLKACPLPTVGQKELKELKDELEKQIAELKHAVQQEISRAFVLSDLHRPSRRNFD